MFKINPYRPGAGLMPGYIAGREKDITNIEQIFDALIMNIPVQSVIFSGLRGVGKTVLINKLESIAEEKKIFCKHIEIEERNDFISQIAECSQAFLRKVSTIEKFKHLIQKPLDAIKSLIISFNPNDNTFSVSMQERELYTSGNLTQSLTEVFVSIGELGVNSISTIRAQLINKGIIYPIRYKELDFTVPEFDGFIRRLSEYKQWCKEDYKDV